VESCSDEACYTHIDYEPIPSKESVIDIINRLREILFPGYFSRGKVDGTIRDFPV
jgi:serine O-acetyltransferase